MTEIKSYGCEGRGMEKERMGIEMRVAQHTVGSLTWVSRGKGGRLKSVYLRTRDHHTALHHEPWTTEQMEFGCPWLSLLSEQVHTESPPKGSAACSSEVLEVKY